MRESQAPRNSRELAVRNQFFTPRYVVEFLTDNTLGRIWYEMRKGDTALKDECRYSGAPAERDFPRARVKAPADRRARRTSPKRTAQAAGPYRTSAKKGPARPAGARPGLSGPATSCFTRSISWSESTRKPGGTPNLVRRCGSPSTLPPKWMRATLPTSSTPRRSGCVLTPGPSARVTFATFRIATWFWRIFTTRRFLPVGHWSTPAPCAKRKRTEFY